jgi:hypothetical protein
VEHAASAGERTYAGVEVRMIQIPSDSGKYGVFEDLHGFTGGKALSEHLEQGWRSFMARLSVTGCVISPMHCRRSPAGKGVTERVREN